ncbi:hypothetical protein [Thauera sinica]|uniref:Transmembrane protein n=1 Tax=Thauera sinica TaxID=2665146 RepID=A0ABW1APF5_9RHOO|nr:hypothetical protein [Thauera sp. K11]
MITRSGDRKERKIAHVSLAINASPFIGVGAVIALMLCVPELVWIWWAPAGLIVLPLLLLNLVWYIYICCRRYRFVVHLFFWLPSTLVFFGYNLLA